jgi:hypothetical protein
VKNGVLECVTLSSDFGLVWIVTRPLATRSQGVRAMYTSPKYKLFLIKVKHHQDVYVMQKDVYILLCYTWDRVLSVMAQIFESKRQFLARKPAVRFAIKISKYEYKNFTVLFNNFVSSSKCGALGYHHDWNKMMINQLPP